MLPDAELGGEGIALNGAEAPTVLAGSLKAGAPTEGLPGSFKGGSTRINVRIDGIPVILLDGFGGHVVGGVHVSMEIEYVRLAPAHSCKFCLLQSFHVTGASDDVGVS